MIRITDPADPRLADFVGLTDVQLRRSLEAEPRAVHRRGREGDQARHRGRATRSGRCWSPQRQAGRARPSRRRAAPRPSTCSRPDAAAALTGYQVHRGALASMQRRPLPPPAQVLAAARRIVVVCEDIVDHGNVGGDLPVRGRARHGRGDLVAALRRPAVPAGGEGVDGCGVRDPVRPADGLARRAVRAAAAGFRLLALTPDRRRSRRSPRPSRGARAALLLGTEGDGLSSRWLAEADQAVCIPMAPGAMAGGRRLAQRRRGRGDRLPVAGGRLVRPGRRIKRSRCAARKPRSSYRESSRSGVCR